jgi:hypothetical protein
MAMYDEFEKAVKTVEMNLLMGGHEKYLAQEKGKLAALRWMSKIFLEPRKNKNKLQEIYKDGFELGLIEACRIVDKNTFLH